MRTLLIIIATISITACKNHVQTHFTIDGRGHIAVPININNKSITACFDTGSSTSILRAKDFRRSSIFLSNDTTELSFPLMHDEALILKNTMPTDFSICGIRSSSKISFNVLPDNYQDIPNILGMDIISQFYWYFDFQTKHLKVSKRPFKIEERDMVQIPYKITSNNRMYCALNLYNKTIVDSIFIDTGMGRGIFGEEVHNIFLRLPYDSEGTKVLHEKMESHIIDANAIPHIDKISYDLRNPITGELFIPLLNYTSHLGDQVLFQGVAHVSPSQDAAYYDSKQMMNGALSISPGGGFSGLYLDTKNQIIYLRCS